MKIYFAGKGITIDQLKTTKVRNKLYSFANDRKEASLWGKGLMLDSGAFSVFTGAAKVDIAELNDFIKTYKPETAIQLDVIGDEEKTWQNYLIQKKEIPDIMPVIHYKASVKHIKRVTESANYILLGGLVPVSFKDKIKWLDYLYSNFKLRNKKIHLLGVTNRKILERYPAYSSDSSSWLRPRAFGTSSRDVDNKVVSFLAKQNGGVDELQKEIQFYLDMEKYITTLWEKRGVVWS